MGSLVKIPLRPGGMLTDVIETDLGQFQHQEVKNLRLVRENEWECVVGYLNIKTGFTNIKAITEVTDDASGDRFLLIQDGTDLKRLTYDDGDGNGYENETATTLTLPSGVTIGATAILRFFIYRGVIRITGASEPLWYGYIDRTLFDGDDSFAVQEWVLEVAKVEITAGSNDIELVAADNIPTKQVVAASDMTNVIYLKFFYIFDGGQYELLKPIENLISGFNYTNVDHEYVIAAASKAVSLQLRVEGSSLKTVMFNKRITGVCLAVVNKEYAGSGVTAEDPRDFYIDEKETFFVPIVLNIDDALSEVAFTVRNAQWDSTKNTELEISDTTNHYYLPAEAGYLGADVDIEVTYNGSTIVTTVNAIDFGDTVSTNALLTVNNSMAAIFGSTGAKTNVGIKIIPKWQYHTSFGYWTHVGIDVDALGSSYLAFTGIGQNTENIAPNYSHHHVIAGRAYVSGMTGDDEADSFRYSPINQFDVLPIDNQILIDVGDNDNLVASAKLGDRIVAFKKKSASQFSFIGTSYNEDINFIQQGLYSVDGILLLGDSLYWMDENDAYVFNGNQTIPIFQRIGLRELYHDNITTTSFIAYNKIDKHDNEIWFFVGTKILVWQIEKKRAYLRETDITPVTAILSFANQIFVASATKIVNFNHSQSTFDESISFSAITKELTNGNTRWHKKLKELDTYLKSSGGITFTAALKDDDSTINVNVALTSITTFRNRVSNGINRLYKELTLTMASTTAATNKTATIREINPTVEQWK
jgi:hypothetical protein